MVFGLLKKKEQTECRKMCCKLEEKENGNPIEHAI